MNTVNAVNKYKAQWPKGYCMFVPHNGVEVTYVEFRQCVKEMSGIKEDSIGTL